MVLGVRHVQCLSDKCHSLGMVELGLIERTVLSTDLARTDHMQHFAVE